MPILAVLFSSIGILGAYVVAVLLIGVDAGNFWSIMQSNVDVWRDVGNGIVMKRFAPRGRGRSGRVYKPFSHLTIVVRQVEAEAGA